MSWIVTIAVFGTLYNVGVPTDAIFWACGMLQLFYRRDIARVYVAAQDD